MMDSAPVVNMEMDKVEAPAPAAATLEQPAAREDELSDYSDPEDEPGMLPHIVP